MKTVGEDSVDCDSVGCDSVGCGQTAQKPRPTIFVDIPRTAQALRVMRYIEIVEPMLQPECQYWRKNYDNGTHAMAMTKDCVTIKYALINTETDDDVGHWKMDSVDSLPVEEPLYKSQVVKVMIIRDILDLLKAIM